MWWINWKIKPFIQKSMSDDRRVTYASITEDGKLMEEIFPKHKEAISRIMGGLDTDEKILVAEKLKKLGLYAQTYND